LHFNEGIGHEGVSYGPDDGFVHPALSTSPELKAMAVRETHDSMRLTECNLLRSIAKVLRLLPFAEQALGVILRLGRDFEQPEHA
jgi:hypothetical protein